MQNSKMIRINSPVSEKTARSLRAGDIVLISGVIYTARDAAHKRLCDLCADGRGLPVDFTDGIIYYAGPTPAKPGRAVGSIGPTSSYRLDIYAEPLLKCGLRLMIGKGPRSSEYKDLLPKYGAVYLSAIGGAGVLISESVKKCDVAAYEDLGAEAVYRLEVEDFHAIVTYDTIGGDLFAEGVERYRKE